jgi:hypothetical protein
MLWVRTENSGRLTWENDTSKNDESDIIIRFYMGVVLGLEKINDTCGKTTHTGTMDRGFTVFVIMT